ncbi:phenylalanine--tRNA ligase subunit alpha [Candidatus Saccharibacteria bacterium]|nr:phenylalanine--tRNA ligase subunit alpha [Candidatus Saccharibacteria bacterium]
MNESDRLVLEELEARLLEAVKTLPAFREVLKNKELKGLAQKMIASKPKEERAVYGQAINAMRQRLQAAVAAREQEIWSAPVEALDVTAPMGINQRQPVPPYGQGSRHPLMMEMARVADIYQRMGFRVVLSRQLDDEFHMFDSLNFPKDHPARDGYDSFRTEEGFLPPAHTSTMQHRILKKFVQDGYPDEQLAVVVPGRVFRNENVDATHEHTFYQCEGVFVSKTATLGQLLGTLKEFFDNYYEQDLKVRTQPGYFPFTEPSFELSIEKPASLGGKGDGWLEMLGCGMIHPNVLEMAGLDSSVWKGFAWGGGIERLVMLRYGITDIRHFEGGRLRFLKEFK